MATVLVVYHSQDKGNTRVMAELVAEGCRSMDGVDVDLVNVNEERVSMEVVEKADGYAIGAPDYFSYPAGNLKQFFDDVYIAARDGLKFGGKPGCAFVTHGGGGRAAEPLERLCKSTKLDLVAPVLLCQGAPESEEDVAAAKELGRKLAERVTG